MVWKSNLATGIPDSSEGLVNVGGLSGAMKSNVHTELIDYNSGKKERGFSSPSRSDMMSSRHYDEGKLPEEEFYKQPEIVETIPESALDKVNLQKVPQEICSTINKVVNQLDIISTTLAVLEQRLDSNENQASQALDFFNKLE